MKTTAIIADPMAVTPAGPGGAVREYRAPAKVFHWLTVGLVFLMVASGVTATQLGEGAAYDFLINLHRMTGAATLIVVLLRLIYRMMHAVPRPALQPRSRTALHWILYGIIVVVPLLGWAGTSDFNHRDILFGLTLPPIFPVNTGYGELLLALHAYIAFALLALVALHVGAAMHDTMAGEPPAGRND
jgi:cytochrome b561